jgi:hypothetical protein
MPMTLSGDGTITGLSAGGLPDGSITQSEIATGVAGKGPAFSAYPTTQQTGITTSTFTKVLFGTERFDTNSNFASSTFTPTVAGYYQLNTSVATIGSVSSITRMIISFYFNGAEYVRAFDSSLTQVNGQATIASISSLIYFNGSTDNAEVYVFGTTASGTVALGNSLQTTFNGCLARAA